LSYSSITTPNGNINNLGYCNDITTFNLPVGTFHDGSGTGNDYLDSTHCFWLIEPNQADTIELTFISYDTEANYDKIKVYDGTTVSSPLIAVFSGFGIYKKLTSTSGAILVEFESDESYTAPGFLATWTTRSVQNGGATTAPVADFIASSTNINAGDKVDFYDLSQNIPTNHSWVFVNGSNSTSFVKNPSNIQYNMPGCYDVSLVVNNNFGTDQTTKTCYINVNALVGLGDGEAYVEKDVKIYPNPADGQFNIFFHPEEDKMTNISITNILGERIYTNNIIGQAEFDEAFDLRSYGSGVYFVNISSGEKFISKKLTIN
jgi:PKD repeat protein